MFRRERRGLRWLPLLGKGPRWAFIWLCRLFPKPRRHLQQGLRKPALQASGPFSGGVGAQPGRHLQALLLPGGRDGVGMRWSGLSLEEEGLPGSAIPRALLTPQPLALVRHG